MKNEILLINERIESNGHFLNNFGSFSIVLFGVKKASGTRDQPCIQSKFQLNV